MAERPTLIVFARAPAIGRGKSRLARDVGAVEAWRAYRTLLDLTLRRLRDPRWRLVVRIAPDRAAGAPGVEPQGAGNLGARLERAIQAHARGAVAVVGSDCPYVTPGHVAAAFRALRTRGGVLGPAGDGGFWLIGLAPARARTVRLSGVRWSSEHACADADRALGGAARLETLDDVDDGAGLRAWRAQRRRRRPGRVEPGPDTAGPDGPRKPPPPGC